LILDDVFVCRNLVSVEVEDADRPARFRAVIWLGSHHDGVFHLAVNEVLWPYLSVDIAEFGE
jgi:hypothetical protein